MSLSWGFVKWVIEVHGINAKNFHIRITHFVFLSISNSIIITFIVEYMYHTFSIGSTLENTVFKTFKVPNLNLLTTLKIFKSFKWLNYLDIRDHANNHRCNLIDNHSINFKVACSLTTYQWIPLTTVKIGQRLIYSNENIVQICLLKRKCLDQFSLVKELNYQMTFSRIMIKGHSTVTKVFCCFFSKTHC